MAVDYFLGLPRSGKSYRAVKFIYDKFVDVKDPKDDKYRYCYTNIGGMKFDKINKIVEFENNQEYKKELLLLDWKVFYSHLQELHQMAEDDVSDDVLLEYMKEHKLTPALYVIDESYRYFKKQSDPVLVWLMAYHGHLGIDLLLITHNLKIGHTDYTHYTEDFVVAQPKKKGYSNNVFRYKHYASPALKKEDEYALSREIVNQDIFDMYKSGDLHNPKKVIFKFIGIGLIALAFVFIMFSQLIGNVKDRTPELMENNVSNELQSIDEKVSNNLKLSSIANTEFLKFRCNEKYCRLSDDNNMYIEFDYSLSYVNEVLEKTNAELFYFEEAGHLKSISSNKINMVVTSYYYHVSKIVKTDFLSSWFIKSEREKRVSLAEANIKPSIDIDNN